MNTYQALKIIRDRLAKDLVEGKKSYEKLSRELEALTKQVRTIEATVAVNTRLVADLDNVLRNTSEAAVAQSQVKPKGKPGRKPKAKVEAATTEPKVRKKPGRKPKAETEAKAAAKADKTPGKRGPKPRKGAAEGRRAVAEGLRPPIKDAIAKVMGGKTMSIDDIFEGLKAKSWLPNSSEPRQYISYLLSTSKDRFERVQGARGVYRPATPSGAKAEKAEKVEKTEKKSKVTISTDDILASAGVLGDATFGG